MSAAIAFALKHWKLAAGGAGLIVLGLLLAIARGEARHWRKVADQETALYQAEKKAQAATAASLDGALGRIADSNRSIEAANQALETARRAAAEDQAQADARWQGTKTQVAALEADARRSGRAPCAVSDEAKKALEGL